MKTKTISKLLVLIISFFSAYSTLFGQTTITGVYTDYNGYWNSSSANISPTQPDNSHNLLGFTTGGTTYSTGVNNATLVSQSVTFNPQVFSAMPATITGTVQYFGVGTNYGGWCNVTPVPITNNKSALLIDGIQGLDLGTAIFNCSSNSFYTVSSIEPSSIGDGIPDIIVTQVGDPSNTLDVFNFTNTANVTIGNAINVNFGTHPPIATCQWKFYNSAAQYVNGGPNTTNCVNSTRQLRMIAFDFADFGITTLNYVSITKLMHKLSGNSDQAFVAYNNTSIILLPITLSSFNVKKVGREVKIDWETEAEINNDFFTIERSQNGLDWENIAIIQGAGNSSNKLSYQTYDKYPFSGTSYYRLFQTDFDGNRTYSSIVSVDFEIGNLYIYPNPASQNIVITGKNAENVRLFDPMGKEVTEMTKIIFADKNSIHLDISKLSSGLYLLKNEDLIYPIQIK